MRKHTPEEVAKYAAAEAIFTECEAKMKALGGAPAYFMCLFGRTGSFSQTNGFSNPAVRLAASQVFSGLLDEGVQREFEQKAQAEKS